MGWNSGVYSLINHDDHEVVCGRFLSSDHHKHSTKTWFKQRWLQELSHEKLYQYSCESVFKSTISFLTRSEPQNN